MDDRLAIMLRFVGRVRDFKTKEGVRCITASRSPFFFIFQKCGYLLAEYVKSVFLAVKSAFSEVSVDRGAVFFYNNFIDLLLKNERDVKKCRMFIRMKA